MNSSFPWTSALSRRPPTPDLPAGRNRSPLGKKRATSAMEAEEELEAKREEEEEACRTPRMTEARIPAAVEPPPTPRKRRFEPPKHAGPVGGRVKEFFASQEIEAFFRDSFACKETRSKR
ncbi:hypothetical protein HPP92_002313 [Vanilla planifolia]|uniref:Uncharacterized protein n=1 Tax=Vanilla planifolia TaxID=51239 RepID=A0A835VMN6_VANPL|nr:hypothetical protein HPP92_002313 [Vanilla planifolia]